jgi:hypothetical protein
MKKIVLLILFPLSAFAQSMSAGLWSSQASFKLNGIPMPPSHSDDCITSDEAKDAKGTIERSLERNSCHLTSWSVKKGILAASVACKNSDYDAKGDLGGRFDKKMYDLAGDIEGTHKVFGDAHASVQFSGRWMKACDSKSVKK